MLLISFLSATTLKAQVQYATLTGKATNEINSIRIYITTQYGIQRNTDTIKVKANGTFTHRIKLNSANSFSLAYGSNKNITVWLKPGDKLEIDLQQISPMFKGSPAMFANYYLEDKAYWTTIFKEYEERNPGFDNGNNRYNDKYFAIQDSITLQRMSFMKTYFASSKNTNIDAFVIRQTLDFIYGSLYYKLAFDGSEAEKFKFYQDKYHINRQGYYLFSDKAVFNDMSLLNVPYYRKFFNQLLMNITSEKIKDSKLKWTINAYIDTAMKVTDELAGRATTTIKLKSIFLDNIIEEVKREHNLKYVDKLNATLIALNKKPDAHIKLLNDKLTQIVLDTKFNKGNKAPDFVLIDELGRSYALNDFKGKQIYIDMGASWCGPCIASIPAWNKFVTANKNNENVVFISLSVDDTEAQWKSFLKKHDIKGLNLYAGAGGFKGKFAIDYNLSNIPHLIHIDENGNILEYSTQIPK